ncbi:MAG: hypothetical protein V5A64_07015 [Candidatus Thermoplasmatota archaeon]
MSKVEEKIDLPEDVQKKIDSIKSDNTSGSTELAKQTAETLVLLTQKQQEDFKTALKTTCYQLHRAQPSMASIFNLVNHVMLLAERNQQDVYGNVRSGCKSFIKNIENSAHRIAKNFKQMIKDGFTILTHSYSSTILNTLIDVNKKLDFNIICTESRPMYEGRKLAENLGREGIDVRLIADSAMFLFLKKADAVVVGCDAISRRGVLNKIGTSCLATSAEKTKTPCYVLCNQNKILPLGFHLKEEKEKNSDEITSKKMKNVSPVNYYFEYTNLDLFTNIVTEKGVQSKKDIEKQMKHQKVHPIFK